MDNACPFQTPCNLCISDILSHDVHLKTKPYVTVCWSDNWTFRLMRALLDSPASSLSWSVHVKVQHTNTGRLSPFQCWSMSPCLFALVQAWWRVVICWESPWPFYPMVMPKPHWNLFLRWLRKAPKASDRGRGTSFFSNVAPTTQLLSKEPEEQEKTGKLSNGTKQEQTFAQLIEIKPKLRYSI